MWPGMYACPHGTTLGVSCLIHWILSFCKVELNSFSTRFSSPASEVDNPEASVDPNFGINSRRPKIRKTNTK